MKRMRLSMILGAALALTTAVAAQSAPTNAQKCEAAKLKAAGKYHFCRLKADRKVVLQGGSPDYSACNSTLTTKWSAAETSFGGACPTFGDQATRQSEATTDAGEMALWLSGGTVPGCGDGTKNGSEQCDGLDLDGNTCQTLGYTLAGGTLACTAGCSFDTSGCTSQQFPATGQTTSYGAGSDGDVQAGATRSFTDNGDGTITDNLTGLMWEKKSGDGSIHDWNNTYTWGMTSPPYTMNGTMVTTFLASLNGGGGFAGHTDWRIPNRFELESLLNLESVLPATYPAFNSGCVASCTVTSCSCTQSSYYWSSTTYQGSPDGAWTVYFNGGFVGYDFKSINTYVRAVRGGS